MGVIAGVVAAGVLAAGATAYAGSQAADAQAKANKTNQDIANATNALNYQMFLQSRGSEGSAILPTYFGSTEQGIADAAARTFAAEQAALGTPADQIAANQAVVQGQLPAMTAGDQLVNQLFTGELANQQVANIAPVIAARGQVAAAQKQGILEGLSVRLNALAADRARAGYTGGGSTLQRNLLTAATIPALQGAATVGAQADLANATDVANIRNQDLATRLGNLNLPLSQAANRIQLNTLPVTATGQNFQTALQPFNWFRIAPAAYQNQRPPLVTPVGTPGQFAAQAGGQFASTIGNYFANQALINQLQQRPNFTVDQYSDPSIGAAGNYGAAATI